MPVSVSGLQSNSMAMTFICLFSYLNMIELNMLLPMFPCGSVHELK